MSSRIIEQCQELQTPLIINYIDFKKAFDSIHRESLWQIVQLYGVPPKDANSFRALYRNSTCHVRTRSGTTDVFDIVTEVRQGCIQSPVLFLIIIDFVMRKSLAGTNFGIKWTQGRMADLDLALISHTHSAVQLMINNLHEHGSKVGLRVSHERTKAMVIGLDQHHPPLYLGELDIEYVQNFTYLGSNISGTGDSEKDAQTRTGKAAGVFQRLRHIWLSNAITTAIKLCLYTSLVIPPVTYGCETWMKTASITNMLDVFHRLPDMVSDRRRRLAGHVLPRERPASVAMSRGRREKEREAKEDVETYV